MRGDWGSARAGLHFNDFKNKFSTFLFDNPFRVTDSHRRLRLPGAEHVQP